MPELPEVESTVRYLAERVLGKTITRADILWPRTIATHSPKEFGSHLLGFKIAHVFRRGKFIAITDSARSKHIFIHLRMSGSLDVVSEKSPVSSHDRAVLHLSNGKTIRFNDTRKFGRIYLCDDPNQVVGKLGIEPLSAEFTPEVLLSILRSRATRIKTLLLDQSAVAGLGNIYVDESLWKAAIHPTTPAKTVSPKRCQALHKAIIETLSEAIELAGTDFGDHVVDGGMYSPVVYGRDSEPCARCGDKIRKMTVNQRGTHFCPRCQRAPRSRHMKPTKRSTNICTGKTK
ncbi:MAG: DNA-formamidopyrimidine glycosylase [Pseudomonadota bacterium]